MNELGEIGLVGASYDATKAALDKLLDPTSTLNVYVDILRTLTEDYSTVTVTDTERTRTADFALRISGDSMEPRFHDGDVVLVEDTDSVDVGEFGIFVLDGNGYFKKYGGDRLVSLIPDYGDILLRGYTEMVCCGRVVGRLKRR